MQKIFQKFLPIFLIIMLVSTFAQRAVHATPAGDNIIISEVEYDATVFGDTTGEWFELFNPTKNSIDISSWTITDGEGIVTFPVGTSIPAGDYFLAVHTTADFLTEHTTLTAGEIDLEYNSHVSSGTFELANGGDELTLSDDGGNQIDFVSWEGHTSGWAVTANESESIYRTSSVDTDSAADWNSTASPSPGSGTLTVFNLAPTDIQIDGANTDSVNENRLVGAQVSTLTTTDADAGDSHTYTLVAGAGDTDNGSFTISGDQLLLNTVPDYENQTSYAIRIQTDDGWGTYSEAFTINVVDIATENDNATTKVWRIDNAANYTLSNPQKIEVTTGIARVAANVPVFDHYWELDEASWNGTVGEVEDSANNGDGTASGANTIPAGIIDRAGTFDRTAHNYVDFGTTTANPGLDDFSYGIWFKTTGDTSLMSLISRSAHSAVDGRYTIFFRYNKIRTKIDLGPEFNIDTAASYNDGNWHFALVNVDRNGDMSLYIDGSLEGTVDISSQSTFDFSGYARNLYLGAYSDSDGIGPYSSLFFDGDLDEAFFINRLLTTTEISNMWNSGNGARLTLEGYSSSKPYLKANQSIHYTSSLSSFTEILSQNNEGAVRYQISPDNGVNWRYWDGSAWATTTATNGSETSTASEINDHLATFDIDGGDFTWRAYLISDGTQKVELDQVNLTFLPNQAPTDILLDGADADSVDENRLIGAEIGVLTSVDADAEDTHTYSLVAGTGDADNSTFSINGDQVLVNAGIDYESQNSYSIRIQSDDGNGGTYQKSFTINAVDILHEADDAITEVWRFDTPANYSLSDTNSLEFHAGTARLTSQLIFDHYWAMDEAIWNGTPNEVIDSAGNGDGVAVNGADTFSAGRIERGGHFTTANDYLDFGTTTANPGLNDFSYGLWFKTDSAAEMSLMARSVFNANDGRYALLINNGRVTALLDRGIITRNITSASAYNDDSWHLAIATIDSDGLHHLYLDGVEVVSRDISPEANFNFNSVVGARNLYIGAYNDTSGTAPHPSLLYYEGELDEAFFINRLLTAAEISDIYNTGEGKRLYAYASDSPYVNLSGSRAFARNLNSFTEYLSQNNEGAVHYQVSSDDGTTWQYWNGSAWANTTATDGTETASATDINANIATLDTDGGNFTWRAYLQSDGTQKVELDHLDITYDLAILEFSVDTADTETSGANFPQLLVEGTLVNNATINIRDLGTGTATQSTDYLFATNPQTITIPAGTYSSATPIDIPAFSLSITNDAIVEADETIDFQIENPVGILLGDANGDGTTDSNQTYTITNDDAAGITLSTISNDTAEDGTTATFSVVLDSQPTDDVIIGISSDDTTEGTVAPASLTFTSANWDTPQTITVTGVDDALIDGTIAYHIITAPATSTDANYNNLDPADVDVSNLDNDAAGITVTTISNDTAEDGTTATFTIVLDSQPTDDVIIGISSDDTTEGTVAPTSLTFTSANWDTPQTITVTGVDDALIDGTIAYHIVTAAAVSGDANYNEMNPDDVDVNNLDNEFPIVLFGANTIPTNGAILSVGPTQLFIEYNMEIKSGGNIVPGAADNIENYLLVRSGTNDIFDTVDCNTGLDTRDALIPINTASYSNANPYIATLSINDGSPLEIGKYRLYICGTTSIENLFDKKLNNGLSDTHLDFEVVAATTLPSTGFPRGHISSLNQQPPAKAYTETAMTLEIPKLGVEMPIVGVPQTEDGWDVTWLGNAAGYLAGTAFPTWTGNTVITGHVWDAWNQSGIFSELKTLGYGDQVQIHAWGLVYTYEVRESKLVTSKNVNTVLQSEEYDWVTLVTCEFYNPFTGDYLFRRAVRAVLVSVK